MNSRTLVALMMATLLAASTSRSVNGQSADLRARVETSAGTAAVKAFIASRLAKGYVPARTPWGDPDISGNFDTSSEANTPLERPTEWEGRAMADISRQELAEAIERRQRAAVESAPFAGGGEAEAGIALAVPIHWFDNLAAVNSRPWFVVDPPDGRIPAPTQATTARQEAAARAQAEARKAPDFRLGGRRDHFTDRSPNERCINPFPELWRTPTIYGNAHQILQTPDYVVFRSEMIHEARIIPLDGRPHTAPTVKTNFGDSRGYWDGTSLVVETVNIHPITTVRGAPSATMRVIERFTRIAPDKVEWTVTLDDPTVWTKPWTYSYPMTVNDAKPIFEYACHEGNYGMANLLTAGRVYDKQGSFGKKP